MTREEFNKGVIDLSTFFPSMDIPDETLNAWFSILKHWPVEVYNGCLLEIALAKGAWFDNGNLVGMCEEYRGKVFNRLLREKEKNKVLPPRPDTINSPAFKKFQAWKKELMNKAMQEKKITCKARQEGKGVLQDKKTQEAKEKWRLDAIALKAKMEEERKGFCLDEN